MDTKEYRTRTLFKAVDNHPLKNGYWPIGLDVGYSSVKVFGPNSANCFPSYAEINQTDVSVGLSGNTEDRNIMFVGEDGTVWSVGAVAQNAMSVSDTTNGYAHWRNLHTHNSSGIEYNQGNDTQHIKYTYCNGHGSDHSQNRSSSYENHTWTTTKNWYNGHNNGVKSKHDFSHLGFDVVDLPVQ